MLQISTNALNTRKRVEIDGHAYTVRRYGAGEQLTLNQLMRAVKKLEPKLTSETATEKEIEQAEQLSEQMLKIFVGLFDDGGDGSKSMALVSSLSQEEVQLLFDQIFEGNDAAASVS